MLRLIHDGSWKIYSKNIREFTTLTLNIKDMDERDTFFAFLSGLKPWTFNELMRQRVNDVDIAELLGCLKVKWKI